MNVRTNEATLQAMQGVLDTQPDDIEAVRIFIQGMGCSGPSFGLTLDKIGPKDVIDKSHDITFVMTEDNYNVSGDMIVELTEGGYLVKPQVESVQACGSCSGCG